MKEIKFRVWSKDNKMFDYLTLRDKDGFIYGIDFKDQNLDIQEYIGLEDKNGISVFEGDILHRKYRMFSSDSEKDQYGVVEFDPINGFTCKGTGVYFYLTNQLPYIIIGNIYENPELLEH